MFHVYALRSKTSGKRYIGQTANLQQRLNKHNNGDSPYTKSRGSWQIIYSEKATTRSAAVKRERFLKSGKGREFLNNLPK